MIGTCVGKGGSVGSTVVRERRGPVTDCSIFVRGCGVRNSSMCRGAVAAASAMTRIVACVLLVLGVTG